MGAISTWMLLAGCQDVIDLDPLDERAPVEARGARPRPISGGTLAITSNGLAVAADPDRDLVHVVDVATRTLRHTVTLEPGDEPGRVTQGSGSLAHVVLRGLGGIATIDLAEGSVLARRRLCPDPRGIHFEETATAERYGSLRTLHVACADGTLVSIDETTGSQLSRQFVAPDLRDVVVIDGVIHVSQLRSATVLGLDGSVLTASGTRSDFKPTVAWRTWEANGQIFMLHQLASTSPVPVLPPPQPEGEGEELPYGGGSFCELGITGAALTSFTAEGPQTLPLPGNSLSVDAAVSPDGELVAFAMPGAAEGEATAGIMMFGDFCQPVLPDPREVDGQVTAVAFAQNGTLVMQSREPARLFVQAHPPRGDVDVVELQGESRYDTGHEIFHRKTDSGLSCASCHPEGTDDGHVWQFEGLGLRRTQPLDVGLEGTAPFHWDGDMNDLDVLMEEVLAHRMGGKRQSSARGQSFARWLFAQERPPADTGHDDPALVQEGEDLFTAYDCGRCHGGPVLGGTMTTAIRGVDLQVPSLRRVSLHPPFMHDGRAPTLEDAARDMVEATTTAEASLRDIEALAAYMRTL